VKKEQKENLEINLPFSPHVEIKKDAKKPLSNIKKELIANLGNSNRNR
jgi:hypothetical protein